jgi:predicted ATPase
MLRPAGSHGGGRVITEIEIKNFKSLEDVRLKLGGFNLFIGANASGKSNFLDALRVVQGIGYGFTIDELFNGKPKSATSEVWEGIRGGSTKATFTGGSTRQEERLLRFAVDLRPRSHQQNTIRYSIDLATRNPAVFVESLLMDNKSIYKSKAFEVLAIVTSTYLAGSDRAKSAIHERSRPSLRQWAQDPEAVPADREIIDLCSQTLSNVQRLNPSPEILREYSQAHMAKRMGERGENFAALIKSILTDDYLTSSYLSWLRQLTPSEPEDIEILEGALGEPLFALREGEEVMPASVLSDGTLRFAAIAAAFFQPDMPGIITIEEIENGIHPSRLRLLVELLKSQSGSSGPQVFATTHSPVVLAWLEESDYETTFLCKRDEETGASIIRPISEIPSLIEQARKQPLGDLFAEGWLEGAF